MEKMSPKGLMALVLSVLLIIGAVGTVGCVGGEIATPGQEASTQVLENVTPQEAFTLIQDNRDNPDFVIIDVRTADEVVDGYIENAINIDFYSAVFRDELDRLDKDKTYLIYCRSGNRSGQALSIMDGLDFREVYDVSGGMIEWEAEGLPIVK